MITALAMVCFSQVTLTAICQPEAARKKREVISAQQEAERKAEESPSIDEATRKLNEYRKTTRDTIYSGDTCLTKAETESAISLEDFEELRHGLMVKDKIGVYQMVMQERVFMLDPNVKVLVLDTGISGSELMCKVRILDGEFVTRIVWLAEDDLKVVERGEVWKSGLAE